MKKLLVIDNIPIVLDGLQYVLSRKGFNVVRASGVDQALLLQEYVDDIEAVVCDMSINGARDGLDLIATIRSRGYGMPVIIYTMRNDLWSLRQIIGANVDHAVFKDENVAELTRAIDMALQGEGYFSNGFKQHLNELERNNGFFSTRALEILHHICAGENSQQISKALCIGEKAVEYHRSAILRHFSCKTMAAAVCRAIKQGFISNDID